VSFSSENEPPDKREGGMDYKYGSLMWQGFSGYKIRDCKLNYVIAHRAMPEVASKKLDRAIKSDSLMREMR
jgi:hypothetical protein